MGTLSHQPASSKEKPSRDLLMNLTDILTLSVTFMPFCDPDKALPPSGWWMQEIFILLAALQRLILSSSASVCGESPYFLSMLQIQLSVKSSI